jgi:hypothetical protein
METVDDRIAAQKTARQMLQWHGADALRFALDEAELADEFSDTNAANAWRDIAREIRNIALPDA